MGAAQTDDEAPFATAGCSFEEHGVTLRLPALRLERGNVVALELPSSMDPDALGACLMGFAPMAQGSTSLFGVDVASASSARLMAARRRVAHAPARPAFLSTMTVQDNVAIPWRDRRAVAERDVLPAVEQKLCALTITLTGRVLPGELSPRARFLVGIARGLIAAPELLIVGWPDPPLPLQLARIVRAELDAAVENGAALLLLGDTDFLTVCDAAVVRTLQVVGGALESETEP